MPGNFRATAPIRLPKIKILIPNGWLFHPHPHTAEPGIEHARGIARELAGAGQRVSRRALRSRGVRGSNEALNALALTLSAELANGTAGLP